MVESFSPDFVEFMRENMNKEKSFMRYFEIEMRKECLNFGNSSFSIKIPIQYRNWLCLHNLRINLQKLGLKYVNSVHLSPNEFAFCYIEPEHSIHKSVNIEHITERSHIHYDKFTHIMVYI